MKKILFGSAAAICAAVGFSSFKTAKVSTTTWYYFRTLTGQDYTKQIGVNPNFTALNNSEIGSLAGHTTSGPNSAPVGLSNCGGSSYYCLVSFTSTQMSSGLAHLKTASGTTQKPVGGAFTKN